MKAERAARRWHRCRQGVARWQRSRFGLPVVIVGLVLLLAGCAAGGPTGWQQLGPSNSDSVILSLAADPFQHELVYAGSSSGTVYRARGDTTGAPITNSVGIPKNTAVSALLPDPGKAGTIFAGTSDGVYVTADYGDLWHAVGTGLPPNDTVDALTFGASSAIFAGTAQHGVYLSSDRGQTWQPMNGGLPAGSDVYVLLWDSASQTLFAGIDGVGLFASTNGGQAWTARTAGLPDKVEVFALAELPSHSFNPSGATLFLGSAQGVYASTDSGQRWSAAGHGIPAGRVLSLATDPNIRGWIYAGTDRTVYRSPDGGKNWSVVAPGLAHPVASIVAIANPATHYVVFAGAGQLVRFPPAEGGGSTLFGNIISWGFIIVLFLLGYYVIRRARRQVLAEQRAPSAIGSAPRDAASGSTAATTTGAATGDVAPGTAALNGHKRPTSSGTSGPPGTRPGGTSGTEPDDNRRRPSDGGDGTPSR